MPTLEREDPVRWYRNKRAVLQVACDDKDRLCQRMQALMRPRLLRKLSPISSKLPGLS
jgi:hypothetical protein